MAFLHLNEDTIEHLSTQLAQEEVYDSGFKFAGSFGVRVSRAGKKAFFLIYSLHGKRKRVTLGHFPLLGLEEARAKAIEILKQVAAGEDPAAQRKRYQQSETFREFAEEFLNEHVAPRCAESTLREYRRIISRELDPLWGDRKLIDIDEQDVHRMLVDIALERNSPVMANRVRSLASSIFSYACSRHLLQENPVASTERVIEEERRDFALSIEEIHQLWHLLADLEPRIEAAFKVLLLTGQRVKDVLDMQWEHVRLDSWSVRGDLQHQIYLSPPASQVLKSLQRVTGLQTHVFASATGKPLRDIRRFARQLNSHMQLDRNWSPSDLRRTVELRLREIGIRPDVVAYVLKQHTELKRLTSLPQNYDYFPESQRALSRWARAIVPQDKTPPKGGKVIPLFGERNL